MINCVVIDNVIHIIPDYLYWTGSRGGGGGGSESGKLVVRLEKGNKEETEDM